ncbi:MAG: SpaA isopeptide-forming pilin-related protein [Thermomicrobiales bacterium]
MLSLVVSLFPPIAPPATAQGNGPLPPPLPVPFQVSLSGSFQAALGCPADFDPTCPQTQLQDNRDGSWSAVLPVPAGDYTFRIVAASDAGSMSLGAGGDPNGADLSLSVPGDAAGAYFSYDRLTGDITAAPVASRVTLVTDLGEQFPMAPLRRGGYQVTWDAQQGNYGFQIQVNEQPVAQDSVSLDGPRRVIVAVDDSGQITAKDTLRGTTLDVTAVDADGQPRPGSCFAILDRDGRLRAQACDADDGQLDGLISLRVPNGLDDGNYILRETQTAQGGVTAEDQKVALGAGRAEATAPAAGAAPGQQAEEPTSEAPPTEEPATGAPGETVVEPGDQPGRLTVIPVDADNQPLPGACYAIVEFGFEMCDDDGDGAIVFDAVPAMAVTLRETAAPPGFAPVPDLTVTVEAGGNRVRVPHEPAEGPPAAEETPTEAPATEQPATTEPSGPEGTGDVVLSLRDRDGNPVSGACWALTNRDSGQAVQACDSDDGADDGRIVFNGLAEGRYRLDEVTTPPGFEPASGQGIDVVAGAPAEFVVEYRPATGEPGRLVITVADDQGNPVGKTCFDLSGPLDLTEICDRQDDGRLNIPDLPAGDYQVTQTQTARGFTPAADTTVTVPAGDTVELPLVNAPEGADQGQEAAPDRGQVVVTVSDESGQPVAGACVTLATADGDVAACDNTDADRSDESGRIELDGVAAGDATLTVQPPEGFAAPDPAPVRVVAGESVRADIALSSLQLQPTETPQTGLLSIFAEDDAGTRLTGGCYTLDIQNQTFGPFCDDDNDGVVMIQGITPGPIVVTETTPPAGAQAADPAQQTIDITAGEEAKVTFKPRPAEQNGTLEVRVRDAAGAPASACVDLNGDAGTFSVCDNREQDANADVGFFRIRGVPPGAYTIGLSGLADGVAAPQPQQVEIVAGETVAIEFSLAASTGKLVIFVENEQGERIGGSCFTIRGETTRLDDVCDEGDDGRLNVPDLPAGDYTVTQTRAQGDRAVAAEQTVTITPGETTEITVANPQPQQEATATPEPEPTATPEPEATATPLPQQEVEQPATTGGLTVINLDPDGNLIGGGCFSVADPSGQVVAERCDNQRGDLDSSPAVIGFGGLAAGAYTLNQTRAPEGFATASALPIDVGPDGLRVDVVSEPAKPETGAVEFATFDDAGNAVPGLCYTLAGNAGSFGPFCDNGEGDTSTEPGVLAVSGLPTGTYEATLDITPDSGAVAVEQSARQRRSVSVRRGDRPTRVNFNIRAQQNQRGDLLVRVRDEDGNYLAGACVGLIPDGETQPSIEVCDNRRDDQNSSDGRILITGLRDGRYTLTQTEAPDGFTAAPDQSVRITSGQVREVSLTNRAERERTATLTIETIDPDGDPLPGACYAILRGSTTTEACDADDGNDDGYTVFNRVEAGSYVVRQVQAPRGGFVAADETAIRIDPGQERTLTVTNERRPGSLLIRKTDQNNQVLGGACFALRSGDRAVYSICDNDASDGNQSDGVILLGTVLPGTYTLRETQSPSGFLAAADQDVTITANQRTQVTVADQPAPPPTRTGDLRIFKVDGNGSALAGACFALVDSNGRTVSPTCDADDGEDNGVILIEGVAVGTYTLRETRRPSADYETVADIAVQVEENRTVDVEVENRLRPGRILIRKSDPNGSPLENACFDLAEDSGGALCTDANGQVLFSGLPPGVYRVTETQAPPGFLTGPALDPVTVRAGSTATIDVVDQPAPPPPDSGSLQVVKFLCPVAEGNAGIVFVDSSDPDGGGLARTAGCLLGDAAFTLDGPSEPLSFRTGTTGRFQTALPTGNYVLTETTSGASEDLVISVNTLTTVVVVNYVEPEPEAPAAIDVIKYTCAPGFQGRLWLDFSDGCVAVENLTNNVGFRLSGPLSARRVTGDTGVGGATRFAGLPSGEYRLREEPPVGTVAVYAFCGLDPDAPDGRAVGTAATLLLAAGQNVTCHWFNVPEDLTTTTGALTVYKFACPITAPLAGFDWYGRCDPQGQGVRFSVSLRDGANLIPVITAATDADGILRLTRLQPGLYDLKEVDASWCHAESDSVNAQGNVVITAGQRASVWIFNCVGPKRPPNTGAGPMWNAPGASAPAVSPGGAALALLWPLAGLGFRRGARRARR